MKRRELLAVLGAKAATLALPRVAMPLLSRGLTRNPVCAGQRTPPSMGAVV